MNPILALLVTEIVRQLPTLAIELVKLLNKPDITDADWDALEAKWKKTTAQYIAEAEAKLKG